MATIGEFNPYQNVGPVYTSTGSGGYGSGGYGGGGGATAPDDYVFVPSGGGYLFPYPGVTGTGILTSPPFVPYNGKPMISAQQLSQLLQDHTFIPMDGNSFCLLCYALDHYRIEADHIFVIHEE